MSQKQVINILLIGEIGIGKSTLINSIKAYLSFETLKQASESPLKPLIPVHFNYAVEEVVLSDDGEDILAVTKEYDIKIGESDYEITEYRSSFSSTLWPRVYCFDYKEDYRIRIIDTPGICDPEGTEQNLQILGSIFNVVQQFSHINLIVFLLLPDLPHFTSGFTTCFKEILSKFQGNITAENIVFAFTQSSVYGFKADKIMIPLEWLIKEIRNKFNLNLTLGKDTLFAMDNVAFRYLCIMAKKAKNPYTDKTKMKKCFKVSRAEVFHLFERAISVKPFDPS